jgi:NAD+ synthase
MDKWVKLGNEISDWILDYANSNNISTLVVGVSGGVDSAVTSILCAQTGLQTVVLNIPINQSESQYELSNHHIQYLHSNWDNVASHVIDLSDTFLAFDIEVGEYKSNLSLANTKARLRMTALYHFAGLLNGIVVGTGNKVEDFGVGFFTKYGDGGVDISPIADLYKSEVYSLAESLGVIQEIQDAAPTDGLWDDGRTDEEQMGATYEELEWAMREIESPSGSENTERQKQVMKRFLELNTNNSHKMKPIPVFKRKIL